MSFPRQLRLFKAWAKAMEEGATVDKPSYRGTTMATRNLKGPRRARRSTRPRRTRRRKNAKTQD